MPLDALHTFASTRMISELACLYLCRHAFCWLLEAADPSAFSVPPLPAAPAASSLLLPEHSNGQALLRDWDCSSVTHQGSQVLTTDCLHMHKDQLWTCLLSLGNPHVPGDTSRLCSIV
jgi:hypothetical protein